VPELRHAGLADAELRRILGEAAARPRGLPGSVEGFQVVETGRLAPDAVRWRPGSTCGVVLAAPGYPACPRLGAPLSALDTEPDLTHVFHAGTRCVDGRLVTAGGRVVVLVAEADCLPAARARVYQHVPRVHFEGAHYRRDIGLP
jgi:phosphoribosylamine--glycine ligase